jgi:DNA polymerase-1
VVEALNVPVFTMEGFEADDVIGTLALQASSDRRQATGNKLNTIIVTGDKDVLQLVRDPSVKVYMPGRMSVGPKLYDEEMVREDLGVMPKQIPDYKGLAGDPSDNIPGVRGIGKVTAAKLLQEYGSLEGLYAHIDELQGSTRKKITEGKESAFESKMLATIVTDVPIKLDLAAAEVKQYDKEKVVEIFNELEFNSLLNKLPNDSFEASVQEALF